MHALNITLLLLIVMFSVGFAGATGDIHCSIAPLAHEIQPTVEVKDPDMNKIIQMPNGYLIAKGFNFSDMWSAAYYASYTTLPHILRQYNVAHNDEQAIMKLTERGAPLFASIVMEAIQHSNKRIKPDHDDHHVSLQRRGILGDIIDWIEDAFGTVACGAFAAAGVGPFLAAAAVFEVLNSGGVSFTDDQLFFTSAAMGYVPPGIVVYYGANFAPGFNSAAGTTFLKSIYLRPRSNTVDTVPATDLANIDRSFAATTRLIVHETWHVRQYGSHGFDLSSFGYDYLYGFCRAGLSYTNNPYEVDARNVANKITSLLYRQEAGFFKIWRLKNLKPILGFPQSSTITSSKWLPTGEAIKALSFQRGILEIRFSSKCYRVWTGSALQTRSAANCNPNEPIVCPPKLSCIPALIRFRIARCKEAIASYTALVKAKTWTCI
ncbi:MAG: hypothetical protein J3R72DRAFT_449939 [Linnemannia gamsii]|nr:MAG: hypothetical protein J3R72DRAFT_449939 [Linnemannia gamsii]